MFSNVFQAHSQALCCLQGSLPTRTSMHAGRCIWDSEGLGGPAGLVLLPGLMRSMHHLCRTRWQVQLGQSVRVAGCASLPECPIEPAASSAAAAVGPQNVALHLSATFTAADATHPAFPPLGRPPTALLAAAGLSISSSSSCQIRAAALAGAVASDQHHQKAAAGLAATLHCASQRQRQCYSSK